MAKFAMVVDFPSPGDGLVNMKTLPPFCAAVNRSEVRAARNDSDTEEFGWWVATSIGEPANPSGNLDFLILGILHNTGVFRFSWMSIGVR